jgi:hypothetical protein
MATHAYIGVSGPEGPNPTVKFIYCHWDGYPEHVGMILSKHFDTPFKVNKLIELGDISSLGETLDKTVFYRKNLRKNDGNDAVTVPLRNYKADRDVAYKYLYTEEGEWECYAHTGDELNFIL